MGKREWTVRGIVPPMITPFDGHGRIHERALRDVVSFLKKHVHGLYLCGTYGSGPLMTVHERKRCVEVVSEEISGDIPIIVHVGASNPSDSFVLARHAQQIGATAVASVPPFYYKHSAEAVFQYFVDLMDATDLPTYVYVNPGTVGYGVEPPLLKRLAEHGLTGIKDSTFDLLYFYKCIESLKGQKFNFVIGTEALIIPTLLMGATASVSGLANAYPEVVVELYNAIQAGNLGQAMEIQRRVVALREIQHYGASIPTIHEMLKLRGVNAGLPKPPFYELTDELKVRVKAALEEVGAL